MYIYIYMTGVWTSSPFFNATHEKEGQNPKKERHPASMCVHTYMYMNTYICTYIDTYIYKKIYIYISFLLSMYVYVQIYLHTKIYIYIHLSLPIWSSKSGSSRAARELDVRLHNGVLELPADEALGVEDRVLLGSSTNALYMYTYIYVWRYIYICIHIYTYIYIDICMCLYMYVYMYTHMYVQDGLSCTLRDLQCGGTGEKTGRHA